jgi:hypothetical protein
MQYLGYKPMVLFLYSEVSHDSLSACVIATIIAIGGR